MDFESILKGIFQEIFPTLSEQEIYDLQAESFPDWDSLALMQIVTQIESAFSITLGISEIKSLNSFVECLTTVQAMKQES